ncbi:MAG TPA: hypothetical protein VMS38_28765 [Pseudorhodoferax sp.]|nr:hypothetical protein [Pseudorhodoferax sp.]
MTWHLEPIQLHGRRFVSGRSFEAGDPYASTVIVQMLGRGRVYLRGLLNDGTQGPIRRSDYLELRDKLRTEYGIEHIESERHGGAKVHDTGPAPL